MESGKGNIFMSQTRDIRESIDEFLSIFETSKELEEYRVKLISYINERCKIIKKEAGFD